MTNTILPLVSRLSTYAAREKRLVAISVAFGLLGLGLPFAFPHIVGVLIDGVLVADPRLAAASIAERTTLLQRLTVWSCIVAVAYVIVGYGKGHFTLKLGNRISARLRQDLFAQLQKLSLRFFETTRSGELVWAVLHEINGVAGLIYAGGLMVVFDAIQLLIALALLFRISQPLTFAILGALPLYLVTVIVLNPHVRDASDRVARHLAVVNSDLHEQFAAIALTRAYHTQDVEIASFRANDAQHLSNILRQSHLGHRMGASSEGVIHLGTAVIVGFGGWLALRDASLSAGLLTEYLGLVGIMYGPLRRFADLNFVLQNSLSSVRRVFRLLATTPGVTDAPDAIMDTPTMGHLDYDDVHFRYDPTSASQETLKGITLSVRPGQRVALVGPSGSGKTTLATLALRLHDVTAGRILIDGIDIRRYALAALRASVAIVQQDTFLFSGSIGDNIRYGSPQATDAQVAAAAETANAHGFIQNLPQGYATPLGERGVNLSGGQRQRIGIARAVLRDPRILILDEATSALDTDSEFLVQQALQRLMQNRACLIIAHRLSSIRNADCIYVLVDGRIVENGTHSQLIEARGDYFRLSDRQANPAG